MSLHQWNENTLRIRNSFFMKICNYLHDTFILYDKSSASLKYRERILRMEIKYGYYSALSTTLDWVKKIIIYNLKNKYNKKL